MSFRNAVCGVGFKMRVLSLLLAGAIASASIGETARSYAQENAKKKADTGKKTETAQKAGTQKTPKKPALAPEYPLPHKIKVPAGIFDGGAGWLNTAAPITMKDLRGKIVIIDFWTFCCINCIHVLPDLDFLEKKYPNQLVVIGCHSAKFDNEKDTEAIREAIVRYEIKHPVVNDNRMAIWNKFGVRSWPSILVMDAEGNACFMRSGEGNREVLDIVVDRLVKYHRATGTLDETPIRLELEGAKHKPTPLKYPGKLLTDEASNRLFISDSNHNRIVVTSLDGTLIDLIGSGAIGAKDGGYAEAQFDHPQGMCLVGETLYVADTENHLLRTVDLKTKKVTTLAGTGEQDRRRTTKGPLKETPLNSPWALSHISGVLYIAMAGPHQMWSHELGSDLIEAYAGSGREDILNGTLEESALAQPSGVTTDGKFMYVVDSEGSAVRKIGIGKNARVTTIVGRSELPSGQSLFSFGDVDGKGRAARLQHPLGIVHHDGFLYVADSYNHKIKKVNLKNNDCVTWLGTGKAGKKLDPVELSEPAGLAIAKGQLYIADTNNHRLLLVDLKTKKTTELKIDKLVPPNPPKPKFDPFTGKPIEMVVAQSIGKVPALKFKIALELPEGFKLNKLAKTTVRLRAENEQTLIAAEHLESRRTATGSDTQIAFEVPLAGDGKATLLVAVTYNFCRAGTGGVCRVKTQRYRIPIEVIASSKQSAIELRAKP